MTDVREKLEVIARLGDHITYKEDVGICYDSALAKVIEDAYMTLKNGITVQEWIPASEPPTTFRDEYGELIPFLVCEEGTEYPFRAMYDGKTWGDGFFAIPVTHWMPLPLPPKGE